VRSLTMRAVDERFCDEVAPQRGAIYQVSITFIFLPQLRKMKYAIPAWYGFLNKSRILHIKSHFMRTFRYGHVKSIISLQQLGQLQDCDDKLFHKATYATMPSVKSSGYNLQTLGHGFCVIFFH